MSDWSDTRVTALQSLWLDGLSASQIAKQLGGLTRNAVIGKVHRLGLSGRRRPSEPGRLERQPRPRTPAPPRPLSAKGRPKPPPLPSRSEPPPEGPGLVSSMVQLGAHACKWPIGDPKSEAFTFCGRASEGRYCLAHERLGTRAGNAWRADRDPVVKRALAGLA